MRTTVSGMSNQLKRLDVVSENIANADRVPDKNGQVYQRKVVVPKKTNNYTRRFNDEMSLKMRRSSQGHMPSRKPVGPIAKNADPNDLKIVEVKGEQLVYNPGHPRADANGYVRMPDVNVVEEMVDLISASRTYEANVTVLNAAKQMAKKALEI